MTPDRDVRVSVKALAVSCVGAAAALHPEAFFNSLYLEPLDGLRAEGRRSTEHGRCTHITPAFSKRCSTGMLLFAGGLFKANVSGCTVASECVKVFLH